MYYFLIALPLILITLKLMGIITLPLLVLLTLLYVVLFA